MSEIIKQAKDKLNEELKSFTGGNKEKAVSSHVAKTLEKFCDTEAFASAVASSEKTLSDCCKEVMNKCGNYISDLEVYSKAAKFYFPNSKINITMGITVDEHTATLDQNDIQEIAKSTKQETPSEAADQTKEPKAETKPKEPKEPKEPKQPKQTEPVMQLSLFEL